MALVMHSISPWSMVAGAWGAHLIAAEVLLHSSLQHLIELTLCCVVLVLYYGPAAAALPVCLCQVPNPELLQEQSEGEAASR